MKKKRKILSFVLLKPSLTQAEILFLFFLNTPTTRASPTSNRRLAPAPPRIPLPQPILTHPLILAYRSHLCYNKQSANNSAAAQLFQSAMVLPPDQSVAW